MMRLRGALGLTQATLAARLSISPRTLSNWECGYWLPPFKQRLHIVLALRDMPPEYVLAIADGLGVSVDPAPTAPPEPSRQGPTPEVLRGVLDAVVRDAADAMNVSANDLRAAIGRALAASAGLGGTLEETQAAVAVKTKRK